MRVKTAAIPLNRLPWSQRPTCPTLCAKPGEPQSADGARRETRHLQRSVCVFHGEHGSLREGCQGEWEGGKGDPNETPTPSRRVGWGRVVGARESRVHGDADPWRRPLACGKTGAKVPSERASCPRCIPCRLEKCEGTLHGALPWRRTAGAEPCEVKASSTVLNGGDEETGLFRPRLVATQLPRALSWFFPDGPPGALFDPTCHIFRGPGPQGLMGGKAHHVPLQVHRPDGSTRGAFQGTRRGLPQAHRFHIDGSSKGTFRWERLRGGASHRIACRRPDADASAPPHRVCGPRGRPRNGRRGRLWQGLGVRRRWVRAAEA